MTWQRLLSIVRASSPFYRELYAGLPEEVARLEELPVVRPADFWAANTLTGNRLLTGPIHDGIVLKSGGTTGKPKFSVFAREEWNDFTKAFGGKLVGSGLVAGDRVANLFYVGELYGSFIFTHRVLEECPTPVVLLPIGGALDVAGVAKLLVDYEATVIAGVPTTILSLVAYLEAHPEIRAKSRLRLALFAGEAMYPDQRERVAQTLPELMVRSIGYASTDAGFLGYADQTCGANEFRSHEASTVVEILDEETHLPLRDVGRSGYLVTTDLARVLMPVLRYPVGDRAQWVEPGGTPDRKFLLLGRTEETARVGPVSLDLEDIRLVLDGFRTQLGAWRFQVVLEHRDEKDRLVVRLQASRPSPEERVNLASEIVAALYRARPMYRECVERQLIHPAEVAWMAPEDMETNPRTGKLKRLIDKRLSTSQ